MPRASFEDAELVVGPGVMQFVEHSTFIGGECSYAEGPSVSEDIWPLFLKHQASIVAVYAFRCDRYALRCGRMLGDLVARIGIRRRFLTEGGIRVSANIVDLGPIDKLADWRRDKVVRLTLVGHFSVLYETRCDSELMSDFRRLYPRATVARRAAADEFLFLAKEDLVELATFVDSLSASSCVIAFSHDAEPALVLMPEATRP